MPRFVAACLATLDYILMNEVRVNRKAADRIASGHPWIFASDVTDRGDAVPGSAGHLWCRDSRVQGQGHSAVPQVVRPGREWRAGLRWAQSCGAGSLPGAAVAALTQDGAGAPRKSRPSVAVPKRSMWVRSRATSSGGMGRVAFRARCLRRADLYVCL